MPVTLETLLPFRPQRVRPRIRLVCLPSAGGAASVFRPWIAALPDDVDICPIELPGRGTRFGERTIHEPEALLAELSLLQKLDELPTVYFGHSLGGRIAFTLVRRGFRADALVVFASRPPHLHQPSVRSTLPRDLLVRELRRLGGTPSAVLDDREMVDLMLPIVRADFSILESLTARSDEKIACPLTVLAASHDVEVTSADIAKWEVHAGGAYRLQTLDGGHFLLNSSPAKVLAEVRRVLDERLAVAG